MRRLSFDLNLARLTATVVASLAMSMALVATGPTPSAAAKPNEEEAVVDEPTEDATDEEVAEAKTIDKSDAQRDEEEPETKRKVAKAKRKTAEKKGNEKVSRDAPAERDRPQMPVPCRATPNTRF